MEDSKDILTEDTVETTQTEPEIPVPEVDLPAPESEAAPLSNDFIPTPETEDEYLPDIEEWQVMEEMMKLDEDGHSGCAIEATLSVIPFFDPDSGEDVTPEEIYSFDIEDCAVRDYCLDGVNVNLELEFDSPYDKDLQALHDMLDEYCSRMAEYELKEPGEADYPIFSISFTTVEHPGQGIATYNQPFAYFKTLPKDEGDHRIIHMMFNIDNFNIDLFKVKKEEIDAMEEYINEKISEGAGI